jgi:hypothetical protein
LMEEVPHANVNVAIHGKGAFLGRADVSALDKIPHRKVHLASHGNLACLGRTDVSHVIRGGGGGRLHVGAACSSRGIHRSGGPRRSQLRRARGNALVLQ